jgi:transcriptional regulator with XRE-family HTH domain
VDETLQERLGRVVRGRREALFLTQEELGERCNLHRTYIGAIERGERNLSLQNIIRLADALGIRVSELIREAEELTT